MSHPLRSFLITAARTDLPTFVDRAFQTVCPGIPFQANWHVDPLAFTGSGHDDQFNCRPSAWLDRRPGFRGMGRLNGVY